MVFSSIEFLWFFMPVVLALYALVPPRQRNLLLALVSGSQASCFRDCDTSPRVSRMPPAAERVARFLAVWR
jgi:hypothetical protein